MTKCKTMFEKTMSDRETIVTVSPPLFIPLSSFSPLEILFGCAIHSKTVSLVSFSIRLYEMMSTGSKEVNDRCLRELYDIIQVVQGN